MTDKDHDKPKPGPAEERLKIDDPDWHGAIRKALKKGKPPEADDKGQTEPPKK